MGEWEVLISLLMQLALCVLPSVFQSVSYLLSKVSCTDFKSVRYCWMTIKLCFLQLKNFELDCLPFPSLPLLLPPSRSFTFLYSLILSILSLLLLPLFLPSLPLSLSPSLSLSPFLPLSFSPSLPLLPSFRGDSTPSEGHCRRLLCPSILRTVCPLLAAWCPGVCMYDVMKTLPKSLGPDLALPRPQTAKGIIWS